VFGVIGFRGSELYIGSFSALDLAERFGTPLYVYDAETIRMAIRDLLEAFSVIDGFELYYSVKANSNPHIVGLIYSHGVGVEASSVGEVFISLKSGVDPGRIMFTSPGVGLDDFRYLVGLGVRINVNSINQIRLLCRLRDRPEEIGVRVNTGVYSGHHRYVMTGAPYYHI
jgi:diaminopimelate decarboxylase